MESNSDTSDVGMLCTGDEAGTHGEDCTCIGVIETFGVLTICL